MIDKAAAFNEVFKDLNPELSWIKDKLCFATIHGSHSYGLATAESDVDIRGITLVPKEYILGFNKKFDQLVRTDPDAQIFNIKKFFSLSVANNPNMLELLFVEPEDHIFVSKLGQILIDNREHFLSKLVKSSYIGYAKSQAHRIKNHRRWLLNKVEAPPSRKDMGLPEKLLIEKNQYDAVKSAIRHKLDEWNPDFEPFSDNQKIYLQGKVADVLTEMEITSDDKWLAAGRSIGLDDNLIAVFKKEKEFENKLEDWANYQKWKKNRNPKRAILEEKFKFDLKHGCQLIRLLRLGKEVLETGKLQVKRIHDREELMAIKTGAWTYEQLIEYADKVEKEVEESYKSSKLPNQPNVKYLDNLCTELIERSLLGET